MAKAIYDKFDPTEFRIPLWVEENANLKELTEYGTPVKSDWVQMTCNGKPVKLKAKVEAPKGRQIEFARQLATVADIRIEMRYVPFLTEHCYRFVECATGKIYTITYLDNFQQRNKFLIIYGKTFVRSGKNCKPIEQPVLEDCPKPSCEPPAHTVHNPYRD